MLIGVLVATVLAIALGWYVGVGRYVETPQLVGRTEAQALKEAQDAGFTFSVAKREYSETAPLGTVISTDPAPGERILPGDTIEGVVSQGKERYEVPNLKGQTLEEAQATLEKLNLEVGDVSRAFDEKVGKGQVIKPAELEVGAQVKRGTVVDLVVSKGRKPVEIRNYTGEKAEEAAAALRKAGFSVREERKFSDDVDKGRVISQSPNSGTGFKKDTITLVVSRGPETVSVPDVVGKPRDEAVKILEGAGLQPRPFGPGNFTVRAQNPRNGDVKPGSSVTIAGF